MSDVAVVLSEKQRQMFKGRLCVLLHKHGVEQTNLTSRIACERLADEIIRQFVEVVGEDN